MRVTTSQYEIGGNNHICSVKTFSSRAESTRLRKKNSLEQATFWHELKSRVAYTIKFFSRNSREEN